jgi:ABC-type proline/glycine betaine transport system ATPase subunit
MISDPYLVVSATVIDFSRATVIVLTNKIFVLPGQANPGKSKIVRVSDRLADWEREIVRKHELEWTGIERHDMRM